jgi:hypothetical protein
VEGVAGSNPVGPTNSPRSLVPRGFLPFRLLEWERPLKSDAYRLSKADFRVMNGSLGVLALKAHIRQEEVRNRMGRGFWLTWMVSIPTKPLLRVAFGVMNAHVSNQREAIMEQKQLEQAQVEHLRGWEPCALA